MALQVSDEKGVVEHSQDGVMAGDVLLRDDHVVVSLRADPVAASCRQLEPSLEAIWLGVEQDVARHASAPFSQWTRPGPRASP